MANAGLADLTIGSFLLWLGRRRWRFQVVGRSMMPCLSPGEEVLVESLAWQTKALAMNDIVVLRHPYKPSLLLVKRIVKITPERGYFVQGDNLAASSDSRNFGWLSDTDILGRVTNRFN